MMTLPLSILDFTPVDSGVSSKQALRNTRELAQLADRPGYTRYWLVEHHNMASQASSVPEIMIAYLAQLTNRIRVGSGGVMLPNHSSLRIAETFRLLEALYPDRIDLGIGRAAGTYPTTALALRRARVDPGRQDFPEQLAELLNFSGEGEGFAPDHPFRSIRATPYDVPLPPLWLLGSSEYSAQEAARMGVGFAFAAHIRSRFAVSAIEKYRATFTPSARLQEPRVILALSVICADTDERVEELMQTFELELALSLTDQDGPLLSPQEVRAHQYTEQERAALQQDIARDLLAQLIAGRPQAVREKLLAWVEKTGADELMISPVIYGHENRVRTCELLAEAFALQ